MKSTGEQCSLFCYQNISELFGLFQKSTENYIEYIDFLWYNHFSKQGVLFRNNLGFDINE